MASTIQSGTFIEVPFKQIIAPDDNVRTTLTDIDELAENIAEVGVLQPITVEELEDGTFSITAGFRRHAAIGKLIAARRFPANKVPVSVRQWATEGDRLVAMLIENLSRVDINCVDEALGIQRLAVEHAITAKAIAKRLHRSEAHVKERLALCALQDVALDLLRTGRMSIGVGVALTKASPALQEKLCRKPDYRIANVNAVQSEVLTEAKQAKRNAHLKVVKEFTSLLVPNSYSPPAHTVMVGIGQGKITSLKALRETLVERGVDATWTVCVQLTFDGEVQLTTWRPSTDDEPVSTYESHKVEQAALRATRLASYSDAISTWVQECDRIAALEEADEDDFHRGFASFKIEWCQQIATKELSAQFLRAAAVAFAKRAAECAKSKASWHVEQWEAIKTLMGWEALEDALRVSNTEADWVAMVLTNAKSTTRAAAWQMSNWLSEPQRDAYNSQRVAADVPPLPPLPEELHAYHDGDPADYDPADVDEILYRFDHQLSNDDDDDEEE